MRDFESFENTYDSREQNRRIGGTGLEAQKLKASRLERLGANEKAKNTVVNFAKKVAVTAAIAIAVVSAVAACGRTSKEIMDTDRAKDVREFRAESITIHGGPNLRDDPYIADVEDNNVLIDLGDENQAINSSYQGVVYYYENSYDANGAWIGFPAAEFADSLYEESFINRRTADKIKNHEEKTDDTVWINGKYVNFERAKEP